MTADCRDFEVLLAVRAAGPIEPAESDRLEAHLSACGLCRSEAEGYREVLEFARLDPSIEAEQRALRGIQGAIATSWKNSRRRRSLRRRIAVGLATAAVVTAALLAPWALRREPVQPPQTDVVWQEPDLSELWQQADSAVPGTSDDTFEESTLYAALDDVDTP